MVVDGNLKEGNCCLVFIPNITIKMPKHPEKKFAVLSVLKEASQVSNQLAEGLFPCDTMFRAWVDSVKEMMVSIRDCKSVKGIEYPPDIKTLFVQGTTKKSVDVDSADDHSEKENIPNRNKQPEAAEQNIDPPVLHTSIKSSFKANAAASSIRTSPKSSDKYVLDSVSSAQSQALQKPSKGSHSNCVSAIAINVQKPSMNKTFAVSPIHDSECVQALEKLSTGAAGLLVEPRVLRSSTKSSGVLIKSSFEEKDIGPSESTLNKQFKSLKDLVCLKPSRCLSKADSGFVSTVNFQTPNTNATFIRTPGNELDSVQTVEKIKVSAHHVIDLCTPVNRKPPKKRKSSVGKEKAIKKKKKDVHEADVASGTKSRSSKHNVEKPQNFVKTAVAVVRDQKKVSAIIKQAPPVAKLESASLKGRQVLEEIKKKEEKATKNLKKVQAERQLKTEESKKKREERRIKILEKKLLMEKEKEKKEIENQKSLSTKDPKKIGQVARIKEMIDQNGKENSPVNASSAEKSYPNVRDLVRTPVSAKMPKNENYEMTPMPDSSIYDSDEEDEGNTHRNGKFIPSWALGVPFKTQLVQQFQYPPDEEEIFGSSVPAPDLTLIFQVRKPQYLKRTSSAVWYTPPLR